MKANNKIFLIIVVVLSINTVGIYYLSGQISYTKTIGAKKDTAFFASEPLEILKNTVDSLLGDNKEKQLEQNSKESQKIASDQLKLAERRTFERLDFFLENSVRASLAVPQDWRNSYKTIENGRFFELYCVSVGSTSEQLLNITFFNEQEWAGAEAIGFEYLVEKDGFYFANKLDKKQKLAVGGEVEKCEKMKEDLPEVLKSLRISH